MTAAKSGETATSSVITLTIGKADATDAMKAVPTTVSKDGKTGATVTMPTMPAGATYGTITVAGDIIISDISISNNTMTYTAAASNEDDTATITLPVNDATNYKNYNLVVTITSVAKIPITVQGVSVTNKEYNGQPAVKTGSPSAVKTSDNTAVTDITGTWTYEFEGEVSTIYGPLENPPTDSGDYRLTVTLKDDPKYIGSAEILFGISQKDLQIKPKDVTITVGDTVPTSFELMFDGIVGNETLNLSSAPTFIFLDAETNESITVDGKTAGTYILKWNNVEDCIVSDGTNGGKKDNYLIDKYSLGRFEVKARPATGGGGGGSSTATEVTNKGVDVIVDGNIETMGKLKTTSDSATVVVDSKLLDQKINDAKAGSSTVVPIPITKDKAVAQLVVEDVEKMAAKDMTLVVKTDKVSYYLPANQIDAMNISKVVGQPDTSKIPISVTITQEKNMKVNGANVVGNPVSFTVTANSSGKTSEVQRFNVMVKRSIEITKEQAQKSTTGVIIENGKVVRHVPTNVYEQDGKYYAMISSITNSTYALINNESTLTDVDGKWYEDTANELSARNVTDGIFSTAFDGDKDITRAEFAALLVNGLGLPRTANASFSDVPSDAWYTKHIATAYEYGIVSGVGDNLYAPNATITRQEAMVMMARAAKVMSYTGKMGELTGFPDAENVSTWAIDGVKFNIGSGLIVGNDGMLLPKDNITRGETASVLLRLLQQGELVDVRSKA